MFTDDSKSENWVGAGIAIFTQNELDTHFTIDALTTKPNNWL
jgi:hypothetical protein